MTAEQEEAEALAREQKEKSAAKEANMFLPPQLAVTPQPAAPPANGKGGAGGGKQGKSASGSSSNATSKAAATIVTTSVSNPSKTATSLTIPSSGGTGAPMSDYSNHHHHYKSDDMEMDKMVFSKKIDLDYIPGLDDELKVILPASFEASLANVPGDEKPIDEGKPTRDDKSSKGAQAANEKKNDSGGGGGGDGDNEDGLKPMIPFSSMFIFGPENCFRQGIHYLVTVKYFDYFIMLVICGSSIALATEDPVDENSARNVFLNYLDYGFTTIFTIEMTLKVSVGGKKNCKQKLELLKFLAKQTHKQTDHRHGHHIASGLVLSRHLEHTRRHGGHMRSVRVRL